MQLSLSTRPKKMEQSLEFVDVLSARRKDYDVLWASRSMDPLLPHKLPTESKYSRKQMIEVVIKDEQVQAAIETMAVTRQVKPSVIEKEARAMINEMASKAHLPTVRWIAILITKVIKRIFLSLYVNESVIMNMKREMQISQVQYVYAPSHRSYMDFILLSYILFNYDMALPNIASGMDFYQMIIVGELLRKTGAFYIRRSFANDLLYKKVFRAYVMSIVSHSDRALEFFIEGTRSRSLKSIVPKYGFLSIILDGLLEGSVPDIHIIPMSISYERPPEELLFAYELLGVPKPKESTLALFRSLSILQKPMAYGRIFFKIAEPISAREYISVAQRRAKVLSPYVKLPSTVTEELAYNIIDSHKKNTILLPFNLIALLFNERTQMYPDSPYTLDSLSGDFLWCMNLLSTAFNATIHTTLQRPFINEANMKVAKLEILDALKPHEELLAFDSSNFLRLKERHKESKLEKSTRVKGHTLTSQTMRIAVSTINITIYSNPTLSFIIKPAIVSAIVGAEGIRLEEAAEQYFFLRKLLSTEFAMPLTTDESALQSEFQDTADLLLNHNCLSIHNGSYMHGQDTKAFSLLYNVILPFIDAVYITCTVLFEWDDSTFGNATTQAILIESQKRVENAVLEGNDWGQHPYSLSLDLFNSTLSNFITQGFVVVCEKQGTYRPDKVLLSQILAKLRNLSYKRPIGLFVNLNLLSTAPTVRAKL